MQFNLKRLSSEKIISNNLIKYGVDDIYYGYPHKKFIYLSKKGSQKITSPNLHNGQPNKQNENTFLIVMIFLTKH